MRSAPRFDIVAPLPSPGRHLHVAVDRRSSPPRAVVLSMYPRALSDDPDRLARLCREIGRAAELLHPNVVPPLGVERVGDDLAAVTVWRDTVTLRELLDVVGGLPTAIAARIAADVCAGLAHAHGRGEPVIHGLLRPEDVLLDEHGVAAVSGFGMPGGSGVADDLVGVAELLHECLVGELLDEPSAGLDDAGVPVSVAALVSQARTPDPEGRHPTAAALGAAIAEAAPLASRDAVAAYVEAILPVGSGLRAERRKTIEAALGATPPAAPEEISEDDILDAEAAASKPLAAPEPAPMPEPQPANEALTVDDDARPSGDRAIASSHPAVTSPTSLSTTAPVSISIVTTAPTSAAAATDTYPANPRPERAGAPAATPEERRGPTPATTAVPAAPSLPPVHPERGGGRSAGVSLAVAVAMYLGGGVSGFALARLAPWDRPAEASTQPVPEARESEAAAPPPVAAVSTRTPSSAPARRRPEPAPDTKRESAPRPAGSSRESSTGMGFLDVTAPAGAEIFLDGRRIGTGHARRPIPAGDHRVEVRHGGARVGERFQVGPGETWTYEVTPR